MRKQGLSLREVLLPFLLFHAFTGTMAQDGYDKLRIVDYYKKQQYENAVHYLRSIESQNDGNASFNTDLGYALFMNEQYDEAAVFFRKTLQQHPDNFEATLYLAQLWSVREKWDSSLFYYNVLTRNYPDNYRFWQKTGGLNYQLGKFDSSLFCYKQAYILNNRSGRVALSIANLLIHDKKTNSADSLISAFLAKDSSDEDIIAKRIEIGFKKSMYDTVIHWGEKLWRDSSKLSAPFVSLAYSYLNNQLYTECLQLCDWLDINNRSNESILYCEALAYAKQGLYEKSNEKLDECLKMSILEAAHTYLTTKADNYESMKVFKKATQYYDTAWYIFHKPYDLYFAGRLYDKYLKKSSATDYYYRLFLKNKPAPKNSGEARVIEYVEGYLREKQKTGKK